MTYAQQTEAERKIDEYKGYITEIDKALKNLDILIPELGKWPRKLIDKNFFALPAFTVIIPATEDSKEFKYQLFYFGTPSYSFEKYAYYISITRDYKLELQNRETVPAYEAAKAFRSHLESKKMEYEANIAELTAFDEKSLIRDLQALYFKYGQPSVWGRILDSYDVKYPKQ